MSAEPTTHGTLRLKAGAQEICGPVRVRSYARSMMSHPDAQQRLRQIVRERLERSFDDVDEGVAWLADITDAERATSLVEGLGGPLNTDELEAICDPLALDQELFSCIVNPTSLEVRRHALEEIAYRLDDDDDDDDGGDDETYALIERIEELDDLSESQIDELIMDIAAYVDVFDIGEADEEGNLSPISPEEYQVLIGMRALPPVSRERIVEFVERERLRMEVDPGPLGEIWVRLPSRSQRLLALLAASKKRSFFESEIAAQLDIETNEVAVAEQDILRACAHYLSEFPDVLGELPISKGFESGRLCYSIGSASAAVVRILVVRGETSEHMPPEAERE